MTSPQPADVAVIQAYQQQTEALRARLEAYLTSAWAALGVYRAAQQLQFARQVAPVVAAAQRQMSALTVGYHAAQRNALIGRSLTVRVDPVSVTGSAARHGADPVEVYSRPFNLVWRRLDELPHVEGAIEQAIQAGLDRAVQTGLTDLQLTKMATSEKVADEDKQVRWIQRVLEGPHSCGLCIVASTQRYHNRAPGLKAIHPACDCSQRFVYGEKYPAPVIDPTTLSDVHDRIAERFGADNAGARTIPGTRDANGRLLQYRDVLITHEHGELGPVLAVRGEPFVGPDDI